MPSFSKTPIAPNTSGVITVKYDTKRVGAFSKTITVTSNATEGVIKLKVKGNVITAK